MRELSFDPPESALFKLKNQDVEIGIEGATGWIRALIFNKNGADPFKELRDGIPGYIGGIRVFDELERRWYSDLESDFEVADFAADDKTASFSKQFAAAPFKLRISFELQNDGLVWNVEAEKIDSAAADRSMRIYFQMPAIAGWKVWAPCKGGEEFGFDGLQTFNFDFVQTSWVGANEIIIPMMSHYDAGKDVGFSLVNPIDDKVPASRFFYSNAERGYNWGDFEKSALTAPYLELCNYYIGLVGDRPMKTRAMIMFHEGHWRPALGKVFDRWREYFVPSNPTMFDIEGVFASLSAQRIDIEKAKKTKLKTMEFHQHFAWYGEYFYNEDKWFTLDAREALWFAFGGPKGDNPRIEWEIEEYIKTHSDREIAKVVLGSSRYRAPAYSYLHHDLRDPYNHDVDSMTDEEVDMVLYHSPERLKNILSRCVEIGINPFWYFNYNDGYRPPMEERFPDSLTTHEDGTKTSSGWRMCHNMNADPKYSYGKYLIESVDDILREYGDLIRGFFIDCFRHYDIDFNHDDGVSVVNNKPVYSMAYAYDDIDKAVKAKLLKADKCTLANMPQSVHIMRWVDSLMLEGSGDKQENKYFWGVIAKPLIYLWGGKGDFDDNDEKYRRAVLYGAYPKQNAETPEEFEHLYEYMPLFEQFKRRIVCFEPDPLLPPRNSRFQVYSQGDDYIASIIDVNIPRGMKVENEHAPFAMFRFKRGYDIGKVGVMYPGDKEFEFVDFKFDGSFIVAPLDRYKNCAVIKLFVTGDSGKMVELKPFPNNAWKHHDPESAFADLSGL